MSTNPEAARPFTSCAYADAAIAKKVSGNEYAHHATLNFLIAFLNNAGLQAYRSQAIKQFRYTDQTNACKIYKHLTLHNL